MTLAPTGRTLTDPRGSRCAVLSMSTGSGLEASHGSKCSWQTCGRDSMRSHQCSRPFMDGPAWDRTHGGPSAIGTFSHPSNDIACKPFSADPSNRNPHHDIAKV